MNIDRQMQRSNAKDIILFHDDLKRLVEHGLEDVVDKLDCFEFGQNVPIRDL